MFQQVNFTVRVKQRHINSANCWVDENPNMSNAGFCGNCILSKLVLEMFNSYKNVLVYTQGDATEVYIDDKFVALIDYLSPSLKTITRFSSQEIKKVKPTTGRAVMTVFTGEPLTFKTTLRLENRHVNRAIKEYPANPSICYECVMSQLAKEVFGTEIITAGGCSASKKLNARILYKENGKFDRYSDSTSDMWKDITPTMEEVTIELNCKEPVW